MELWEEDLYELLGVDAEASAEEIKKAYKKLAIEFHPDRFPEDEEKRAEAAQHFSRITNAYNVLKDEEERAEYDFARRMGFGGMAGPGPGPAAGAAARAAASAGDEGDATSELKKSQAVNLFDQARVYHKGKNYQKAIAAYKEAIRLDPTVADYHAHLGWAYMQQGLKSPSNSAFEKAYKLDKSNKLVKEHYAASGAKGAAKGVGTGGRNAKPAGLMDQLMSLLGGLGLSVGKDAKPAKGKKGAAKKKAGARR